MTTFFEDDHEEKEERRDEPTPPEVLPRAKGGIARAEALLPEQRSAIARRAAESRWTNAIPEVLCAGELKLGNVQIPCYVTKDGQRLISGRGMQEALRLVDAEVPKSGEKPGSRLTRLLNGKQLKPLIFKDKSPDHFAPVRVRFQGKTIHGFDAEMLAEICEGMLEARAQGVHLTPRQAVIAAQCEVLMRAFAKVGIAALIDEATGYQSIRPVDALRSYLESILRKELAAWLKRFPDEFYENIYRLKGWPWPGMAKNRYSVVAKYTNDLIYERLAPGLKEELDRRNPRDEKGRRKHKHHQWLAEPGDQMFAQLMFTVLAIQRACLSKPENKWAHFTDMINDILPKKGTTMALPFPDPPSAR